MKDYFEYTYTCGVNLYKISRRFGVSVSELMKINNIRSPEICYEGRTIKIPIKDKRDR